MKNIFSLITLTFVISLGFAQNFEMIVNSYGNQSIKIMSGPDDGPVCTKGDDSTCNTNGKTG